MDKELKAKWVAALLGGEYAQGKGQLYKPEDGTYCCLGVLCEVARQDLTTGVRNDSHLYQWAKEQIGGEAVTTLWKMNDGIDEHARHSFMQIADFIEANL